MLSNRREFLKTSAAIAIGSVIPTQVMAEPVSPFIEYAENDFKINHWEKGVVPYESTKHHKELAQIYDDERFVLVKKYRQGGFTTMSILYALYECLHKEGQNIGIISRTYHQSRCIKDMFNVAACNLSINHGIVRNTERYIEFKNGNEMCFLPAIQCCGRSLTTVMFDEPAFWDDLESHYTAILPTISNGGKMFMVSTPNGASDYFYKLWKTDNHFKKYAPSCFEHPYYTPEKIALLKGNLGEKGWKRECLAEFQEKPY